MQAPSDSARRPTAVFIHDADASPKYGVFVALSRTARQVKSVLAARVFAEAKVQQFCVCILLE
jgi:hypothetical protein